MSKTIDLVALRQRWGGMLKRCRSDRPEVAKNYKLRGITVCDEWQSFDAFAAYVIAHLGPPEMERATIDRIDNDKGYQPGNVRWATYTENLRNRRNNRFVEWQGQPITIAELAEKHGMAYNLLMDRIARRGWPVEKAVALPPDKGRRTIKVNAVTELRVSHQGRTQTLSEWAKELSFDRELVRVRLHKGWPFERCISQPSDKGSAMREIAERFDYQGENLTLKELAPRVGLAPATLRYRLQIRRLPLEDAILSIQAFKSKHAPRCRGTA